MKQKNQDNNTKAKAKNMKYATLKYKQFFYYDKITKQDYRARLYFRFALNKLKLMGNLIYIYTPLGT
jgi:hypothetical protein